MSLVRPFPARLVKQEHAANVVCPMHDALSSAQRANLLLENPLSYLNVTRNAMDMPGASYDEIGSANAAGLERLLRSGAYHQLEEPGLYVYRISQNGEEHTGIVADVDVSGFVDGRVLGHEDTKPEKVNALAKHFEAVPTRSELVAVMHRDDDEVNAIVAATTSRSPLLTLTDLTGVEQQVWRIAETDVPTVTEHLGVLTHYVADGHHRVAATVARWRTHGSPRGGTVLCVLYPESQTHLLAFHRLIAGPIDADALLAGLKEQYDVTEVPAPSSTAGRAASTSESIASHGVFGLHLGSRWYQLSRRSTERGEGASGLDVAIIDTEILRPLLDVYSGHDRVSYVSDLADVIDVAHTHPDDALFLLAAPTHDELIDIATRGEVMPPKSTYIEPKPRAGVFLHPRQGPVNPDDLPSATSSDGA